jgi:Tfp pilus assembly protein PilN
MIKVNLVPAELLAKARQRQLILQASVVGALVLVVVLLASAVHWYGMHSLKNQLAYAEAELQRLDAIVKQVEELEKAANAVRARLSVIEDLLRGRSFYPIFMSDFAKSVPPGVMISALNTTVPAPGNLKMTISGRANANEDIAAFVKSLEKTGRFAAVEMGPVAAAGTQFNFTMTATYSNK